MFGHHYESMSYAYLIKYFRKALFYLRDREKKEAEMIEKYYPDIYNLAEWQVLLSNWKLLNRVRSITDFQAKRFAAYIKTGKFVYAANLFTKWKPLKIETVTEKYNITGLPGLRNRRERYYRSNLKKHEFDADHYKAYDASSSEAEIEERAEYDYRKLLLVQQDVLKDLDGYQISDKELADILCPDKTEESWKIRLQEAQTTFCSKFDLHEQIMTYKEMLDDDKLAEAFSDLIETIESIYHNEFVNKKLYSLYYYRTLQDYFFCIHNGINYILEERYKYQFTGA